jgi:hypothetical protein
MIPPPAQVREWEEAKKKEEEEDKRLLGMWASKYAPRQLTRGFKQPKHKHKQMEMEMVLWQLSYRLHAKKSVL